MSVTLKTVFRGARGPFLVASAIPVFLGGALAYRDIGTLDWTVFALILAGIVAVHAAANMSNDYFDFKNKTDIVNRHRTVFSGGSGVLVENIMPMKAFKIVFISLYAAALFIGLYLAITFNGNPLILPLLILSGFFLTYFYSSPPIYLAHRGLGELSVGLCFGPLPVFGTFFLLTGKTSLIPVFASIPIMMLIIAVLWINQFPDVEADAYASKKNLVLRMGTRGARTGYYLLIASAYAAIPLLVIAGPLPGFSLLALVTVPFGLKASGILAKKHDDPKGIFPAMGITILNHHLTGLLVIGGILIEKFAK